MRRAWLGGFLALEPMEMSPPSGKQTTAVLILSAVNGQSNTKAAEKPLLTVTTQLQTHIAGASAPPASTAQGPCGLPTVGCAAGPGRRPDRLPRRVVRAPPPAPRQPP